MPQEYMDHMLLGSVKFKKNENIIITTSLAIN